MTKILVDMVVVVFIFVTSIAHFGCSKLEVALDIVHFGPFEQQNGSLEETVILHVNFEPIEY
mgnify:FL=1